MSPRLAQWIIGMLVAALFSIWTYWQTQQDNRQDIHEEGHDSKVESLKGLFTAFIDSRTEVVKTSHEADARLSADVESLKKRLDRHDARIGYLERRGISAREPHAGSAP